jgi:competence protein ComEA
LHLYSILIISKQCSTDKKNLAILTLTSWITPGSELDEQVLHRVNSPTIKENLKMKANLFAALLSFCVISLPTHAAPAAPILAEKQQERLGKINLNKADARSLANSVKGIGAKRAEAIVKYREEHGRFKSVEELAEVRGIGKQYVKRNLAQLKTKFSVD